MEVSVALVVVEDVVVGIAGEMCTQQNAIVGKRTTVFFKHE